MENLEKKINLFAELGKLFRDIHSNNLNSNILIGLKFLMNASHYRTNIINGLQQKITRKPY